MSIARFSLFLCFAGVALHGCEQPSDVAFGRVGNYSVVAVLSSHLETQKVQVYRVSDEGKPTAIEDLFISGAIVSVNNVSFTEMFDTLYQTKFYGLKWPGFVKPEVTYSLSIRVGSETISGKTQTPSAVVFWGHPKVIEKKMSSDENTILLRWQRSTNAAGYILNSRIPPSDFAGGFFTSWVTRDTAASVVLPWIGRYVVTVGAFDRNYDNHFLRGLDVAGIRGAYGVFASIAVDSVVINVTR